jgi:hypothetical protein
LSRNSVASTAAWVRRSMPNLASSRDTYFRQYRTTEPSTASNIRPWPRLPSTSSRASLLAAHNASGGLPWSSSAVSLGSSCSPSTSRTICSSRSRYFWSGA